MTHKALIQKVDQQKERVLQVSTPRVEQRKSSLFPVQQSWIGQTSKCYHCSQSNITLHLLTTIPQQWKAGLCKLLIQFSNSTVLNGSSLIVSQQGLLSLGRHWLVFPTLEGIVPSLLSESLTHSSWGFWEKFHFSEFSTLPGLPPKFQQWPGSMCFT